MSEHEIEGTVETVTIQGVTFDFVVRYAEGHVVTAEEAIILQRALVAAVRNNFEPGLKEALEAGLASEEYLSEKRAEFAAVMATYAFKPRGRGTSVDPVENKARSLAKKVVKNLLKSKGYDLKTLDEEMLETFVDQALAATPSIREEAARIVASEKAFAGVELKGLSL